MADRLGLTLDLPRHLGAESIARREIARWFEGRPCNVRVSDAQLVASELVTNAVRHGAGPIRLDAQSTRDTVSMQVHDGGRGFAAPRSARPTSGLALVDAVCDAWGVGRGATNVWCELRGADASPPNGRRRA